MTGKTYDYIVTIKPGNSHGAFNLVAQILIFITIAAAVNVYLHTNVVLDRNLALGLAILCLIAGVFSRVTGNQYRFALFFCFITWALVMHQVLIGLLFTFVAFLERQVKFKQELGFDEDGITVNSFPKRKYLWHEVNHVILKEGIITVDLHKNKVLQKEIDSDVTDEEEKEFNEFCREHLFSFAAKS